MNSRLTTRARSLHLQRHGDDRQGRGLRSPRCRDHQGACTPTATTNSDASRGREVVTRVRLHEGSLASWSTAQTSIGRGKMRVKNTRIRFTPFHERVAPSVVVDEGDDFAMADVQRARPPTPDFTETDRTRSSSHARSLAPKTRTCKKARSPCSPRMMTPWVTSPRLKACPRLS